MVSNYPDSTSESWTFDANDAAASHTDVRAYTTNYTLDQAGRLTGITFPHDTALSLVYDAASRKTGMTDGSGALILKDFIQDGMQSTSVTLPDMECNNCTLQFIQIMTDKSPYTVDGTSDDIYFNCADITLSTTAPPPADSTPNPGQEAGVDPPPEGGVDSGCCSTSGGSPTGILLGLVVGGLILRRRRRR